TSLSLYNQRQLVDISLTKLLEQNEMYAVGMNGEIENVKFGIYSTDVVIAQDESQIPADGLVATAYCDSEGKIAFDCDLPIGFDWYIQEIETDEHYILSDEKYDFSTEYQGQETEKIKVEIDANINELKTGEIQGMKLDDSAKPLAGAVIGIFKADAEKFTADTAVTTTISAEDGTFSFLNIPVGKYIVKEITAPDDYLIDPNNYVIDLTDNEQIVTLEIVNVLKRGDIQGTKVDDKGNALAGAVIGLFNADTAEFTEETALMTVTSDENGSFSFKNIPVGKYIVKELKAPKGYKLNEKNFDVVIAENAQVVTVEIINEAEKTEKKSPFTGANDNEQFMNSISFVYAAGAVILLSAAAAKRKKNSHNTYLR
ncbi:MAG: prealbumin-like fold domain-containing protein, partial [Lachnospiraceae bacterium]|nr:prealbumin-like fold domain-containing protein [Lachnospiraceae bacterium]